MLASMVSIMLEALTMKPLYSSHPLTPSKQQHDVCSFRTDQILFSSITILIIGASGDLAQTKTYPAVFQMIMNHGGCGSHAVAGDTPPPTIQICGVARTALSKDQFHQRIRYVLLLCERVFMVIFSF